MIYTSAMELVAETISKQPTAYAGSFGTYPGSTRLSDNFPSRNIRANLPRGVERNHSRPKLGMRFSGHYTTLEPWHFRHKADDMLVPAFDHSGRNIPLLLTLL